MQLHQFESAFKFAYLINLLIIRKPKVDSSTVAAMQASPQSPSGSKVPEFPYPVAHSRLYQAIHSHACLFVPKKSADFGV
jgi:hypothetical protein